MDNLHFQFVRAGLKFIIGTLQRTVPKLNFRQHGVEAVDEPSNFVTIKSGRSNFVILVRGHHSHGVF